MDGFYAAAAYAGAGIAVGSALFAAARLRREALFSILGTLFSGAAIAGTLAMYMLLMDVELKFIPQLSLLAFGAVLGLQAGRAVPLYRHRTAVVSKGAGWYFVPAALAVAALQVTAVRDSLDGVIISFAALHVGAAFAVAASAVLLLRRLFVSETWPAPAAVTATAASPATAGNCPSCGATVSAGQRFCRACGCELERVAATTQ